MQILISYGHNDPDGSDLLTERLKNDLEAQGYTERGIAPQLREL